MKRLLMMALLLLVLVSIWFPHFAFGIDEEQAKALRVSPAPGAAEVFRIDARLWWLSEVRGNISAGENHTMIVPGDVLDLRDDMGIRRGTLQELNLTYHSGQLSRISLHFIEGKFPGVTTLTKTVVYNQEHFNAAEHWDTTVNVLIGELGYDHALFNRPFVTMWGGMGIGYYGFTSGFLIGNGRDRDLEDVRTMAPSVHVDAAVGLAETLSLRGEVRYAFLGLENLAEGLGKLQFLSARAALLWHALPQVNVEAGLNWLQVRARYAGIEVDDNYGDNRINMRATGPSLGVTVMF